MMEPAENYVPAALAEHFRRQALRVWMATVAVVFLWDIVIVGAPLLRQAGLVSVSAPVYTFFSFLCHQISDRSFHIDGEPLAVCSRCFGVYFGLCAGVGVYPLWRSIDDITPLPRFWLFASLLPMAVDWGLTFVGVWENTHISRFLTGLIVGVACATFIVPALVEITRNFSRRRALQGVNIH
jgi:uncharacterized membrane protein